MTEAELMFIGNATALLRLGEFTLLTDPNFLHRGELAYLGYGLVSRRRTDPALELADLPPLDAVLLSHLHGDHWDRRARRGLDRQLPILTTDHAATRLRRRDGFPGAVGLRTWQSHRLVKGSQTLTVTALPALHSTNPVLKVLLPPVMGSLLELVDDGRPAVRVYVTGDTMLHPGLDEIARRHPDIDCAVLHLGGTTLPGGFVVTMTGADGVECLRRIQPRAAVPVHYDDYGVFRSGLDDFVAALSAADLDVDLRMAGRGETVRLG